MNSTWHSNHYSNVNAGQMLFCLIPIIGITQGIFFENEGMRLLQFALLLNNNIYLFPEDFGSF